jgi:hypothetical protein
VWVWGCLCRLPFATNGFRHAEHLKKFSLQRDFSCAPVDCYFGLRIQNIPNTLHLASVKWHMPLRIRGMRKRPRALPTPERFSSSTYDLLRYGSVWSIKNYFFKYGAGSQVSSEFCIRTLMDSRNFWIRFQTRPKNSYTYSMPNEFQELMTAFQTYISDHWPDPDSKPWA